MYDSIIDLFKDQDECVFRMRSMTLHYGVVIKTESLSLSSTPNSE
jgi:hypothetical protein